MRFWARRARASRRWSNASWANVRRAHGLPGTGAVEPGQPADCLMLDLDRLDRDAIMPVDPLDHVFACATAADIIATGWAAVSNLPDKIASSSRQALARWHEPFRTRLF